MDGRKMVNRRELQKETGLPEQVLAVALTTAERTCFFGVYKYDRADALRRARDYCMELAAKYGMLYAVSGSKQNKARAERFAGYAARVNGLLRDDGG